MKTKIKICGLTKAEEAEMINENAVDYAGFVLFYEKSKRAVSLPQAQAIRERLLPSVQAVAVTVSPDPEQVQRIMDAGFEILQIHGNLTREVLECVRIPVWYAVNVGRSGEMMEEARFLRGLPEKLSDKIRGILVDGTEYGGGKPFAWEEKKNLLEAIWKTGGEEPSKPGRTRILAGGLTEENVAEGIRMFSPDVVDVSSGVEGSRGKDPEKIRCFCSRVYNGYN